jgi:PAS domain S-box-containing protein
MSPPNWIDDKEGYNFQVLSEDGERVLLRGHYESAENATTTLLLGPSSEYPTPELIAHLTNENSLRAYLDSSWAARPVRLVRKGSVTGLMLEDPGGEPLARLVGAPMQVSRFLGLAIALSDTLAKMHEAGLLHKDIKPSNILVNPSGDRAWLTGFGIASPLPRERQTPAPPEVIAGTFAYMAPEQTGRMNRSIDARSDLYALGVTFYQMLTSALPFVAADPMEWIHCHIARQPTPPVERLTGKLPAQVSAITMKLLAKMPDERYQTARGLAHDLRRCLAEWQATGRIDDFPLGKHDTPDRLLIPETLYGREAEIATLTAAFDRVVVGGMPELVLVSGYSGVGKSSVVNELHRMLVQPRGLFAAGKFDQYKRDIPYATVAQAFQNLIRQILGNDEMELVRWRETLREALGPNGQLMVNLVPELALIIGEQPPVSDLSGPESKRRLLLVFESFLGVFARPQHPLVLFLDDLQWLDAATLDVFEYLATQSDMRHLLLIGAYRDNEVTPEHPLAHCLETIRQSKRRMQTIALRDLRRDDVARLIADALTAESEAIDPLADVVFEKAGGNPFFTTQFVAALVDEGLMTYDAEGSAWRWDLDRIRAKHISDSVVELMMERLRRLSPASLRALQHMACLGSRVEITGLCRILNLPAQETRALLVEPLRGGLLLPVDNAYTFAHDRVQEAVYALLPASDRAETHYLIGSRLLAALDEAELDAQIFEVASQLNRGGLIHCPIDERNRAASLNLRAGRTAKASAAYAAACNYLAEGQALLGEGAWTAHYERAFALALEQAECTFLRGDFNATEAIIESILDRAVSDIDKAAVYRLKIELHVVKSQNEEAVESGLAALRLFGIDFSSHPDLREVEDEYARIWVNLDRRPIECLAELPAMTDPQMLTVMRLLAEVWPPSYFTDFNLTTLAICRMVNITLLHGTANASPQGIALLGWLMGPVFSNYADGYRIALLAWKLVSKEGAPVDRARTGDTIGLTASWSQPLLVSIDWSRKAYQLGVQAGDRYYACYSSAHASLHLLMSGQPLEVIAPECRDYLEFARSIDFRDGIDLILGTERTIASLRGQTRGLSSFSDDDFDEDTFEAQLTDNRMNVVSFWYWTRKTMLHVLSGDYEAALAASDKVQPGPWVKIVQVQHLDYHYYTALALVACLDQVAGEPREALRERLSSHHRQIEMWAEQTRSPTFADKHTLVSAEIARLEGRVVDAERLYEDSIRLARQNGFLQNEALAFELAARFYATRGFDEFAYLYLGNARRCYQTWGATAKVRQLNELHPHLRDEQPPAGSTRTTIAPVEHFDLATVTKVAQTVSGEIVLEKLIETLMRTAIEHAGAERAVLMLARGAEYQVEAEATTTGQGVIVQLRDAFEADVAFPETILQYVMRTKETVILDNAVIDNHFAADAFVREHRVRSLLALPLINQGKLTGLLYLENNLAANVFTPNRTSILKLIASHAAIALENTRLYRDLEEREARIRRLVDSNIVGIVIWDLDGRLLDANDAFLRMVQYDREDLDAGMRWFDMTPPEWQEAHVHEEAEELKATGMLQVREKEYFRKDGSRVPVLIGAATFDGQPHQGVAYILDLSERKRAEEAARRSEQRYRQVQSELAHANRVATVGHLSAAISHDVRQPLVGVVTSASAGLNWLAADPPNIGAARRALERVVREGHRAAEVLDRTRALVKKVPPKTEIVGINDVISDAVVVISAEALQRNVALQIELEEDLPPVLADRVQLQQVILNLIINAIEAMSTVDGRRELTVVSGKDPQGLIYVAVRDTGPGVPQELHSKLFDAFYSTKSDGMGMGLAISRTIVEAHGGRVWVSSNEPQGSIFWFSLPTGGEEARSSTIARSAPSAG